MHVMFLLTNTAYPIIGPHNCVKTIIEEYKKDTSIPLDKFMDNTIVVGCTVPAVAKIYGSVYAELQDDETIRHIRDEEGLLTDEIELKL